VIKLLRSKEASNVVDIKSWPGCLDTDELAKRKLPGIYRAPTPELVAYLDFSVSTTGMLAGIKMSHSRYDPPTFTCSWVFGRPGRPIVRTCLLRL
jgi:hypothetical protein